MTEGGNFFNILTQQYNNSGKSKRINWKRLETNREFNNVPSFKINIQ